MRGAQWHSPCQGFRPGIIPADAGSTLLGQRQGRRLQDHPRGCGEHCRPGSEAAGCAGSSPRMRGALQSMSFGYTSPRIIPADAGSTCNPRQECAAYTDHPRGCGEHRVPPGPDPGSRGSSPRMRGALYLQVRVLCACGIIPADAGSTRILRLVLTRLWDHPRGCGEHIPVKWGRRNFRGSSPRMRGAHIRSRSTPKGRRIIPADAGSTLCF